MKPVRGIGVAVAAAAALVATTASAGTAATPETGTTAQAASRYKVLKHLDYRGPGQLSLRLGYYNRPADKGFGWTKIKNKHNITKYAAVEFVAKSPNRQHKSGKSYWQTAYAGKYRCHNGACHLVKQYKVILATDERTLRDSHDFGAVTEHCVGIIRCPNWVTTALANANRRSAATWTPHGTANIAGYAPLPHHARGASHHAMHHIGSFRSLTD